MALFDRSDTAREMDVIGVDVAALVRLTRAILPGMVERGRGGVLNVASTIAFQPAAIVTELLVGVYAGLVLLATLSSTGVPSHEASLTTQ